MIKEKFYVKLSEIHANSCPKSRQEVYDILLEKRSKFSCPNRKVFRFVYSRLQFDFQGWCLIAIILCSAIRIYHDRDFWVQIWVYILSILEQ